MALALSPSNLKVYKNILSLVWKYGNRDMLAKAGAGSDFPGEDAERSDDPQELARDLENLGPTYVKAGQILSAQLNVLPTPYMDAMSRLQDEVEPFPFEQAVEIIEKELGCPIRDLFSHIDTTPLAAASLGQVHRGRTLSGDEVAIKVQRPGAEDQIVNDFDAIIHAAKTLDGLTSKSYNFQRIAEHTREVILAELDYRRELGNLQVMGDMLGHTQEIVVPRGYADLSGRRVLTMQFCPGQKAAELTPRQIDEINGPHLAQVLFKCYLDQILVEGIFHADPHPGNVLIDDDGRVVLLDLGQVGRIAPRQREKLIQLVLAISEGRGEQVADIALEIGNPEREYHDPPFRQKVASLVMQHQTDDIDSLSIGQVVLEIASICGEYGVGIPPVVTTIGKTLLNLDQFGECIAPQFNPRNAIRHHTAAILRGHLISLLNPLTLVDPLLEMKRLLEHTPRRLNTLFDNLARMDQGFRIDAIDEDRLIHGFEKIANRITYGVMVAAMFIAGAMIMNVENAGPTLGGVPILAILCFLLGSVGGLLTLGAMAVFRR